MATLDEMNQAVLHGKTKILTLDRIKELTGKRIATIYFNFRPPFMHEVDEFIVGEIKSAFDLHPDQKSVVKELKSSPHLLKRMKSTLEVLTEEGRRTSIRVESYKKQNIHRS
ncbi:MAG: hypothetical protein Q8M08_10085 [Bacteroidales bacterium]|nr:hypothetical protein [Bacteroidales bacterium]